MSRGPELPSVQQLLDIAEDFGIDMTAERAGQYRDAMSGGIRALRRIDDMVEERPEVKYPRTPGRRPKPEENPYNAWYWLTDIKGAASGPLAGELAPHLLLARRSRLTRSPSWQSRRLASRPARSTSRR